MSEQFLVPQLTEKEKAVYEKCLKAIDGLSVKEAETILYELLSQIKKSSVITA